MSIDQPRNCLWCRIRYGKPTEKRVIVYICCFKDGHAHHAQRGHLSMNTAKKWAERELRDRYEKVISA